MTVRTLRLAVLATTIASLAAAPALATQTSEQSAAQPTAAAATQRADDAERHAANTAAVSRDGQKATAANSRTAKQVWRERHHLPNAK